MEVYTHGKFHQFRICGCQVINAQMFSLRCSIHETTFLEGFWASPPPSPKYGTRLLRFWPEVVSRKTKTSSKQSFKIKCLSGNGTYLKLGPIYYWKTQNFPWNRILMTIKQHKYQVPDKSHYPYKINQKKLFLGTQMDFLR